MKILHFIETRIKTIHLETLIARWYMEFPLSNLFWSRRLEHSLHSLSLSLACSRSCQRPWQKALCSWSIQILKLTSRTLARVEWLCWSLIYNDLQQNGFARGRTQRTEQERLNIFFFFPLSHVRDEPGMSWLCSGHIRNKKIFFVSGTLWACLTSTHVWHGYLANFGVSMQHSSFLAKDTIKQQCGTALHKSMLRCLPNRPCQSANKSATLWGIT